MSPLPRLIGGADRVFFIPRQGGDLGQIRSKSVEPLQVFLWGNRRRAGPASSARVCCSGAGLGRASLGADGLAKRNRGLNSSFTVRKISHGEGVERVFQTYSPVVSEIQVKRRGDVRRAKLYYLRGRTGKAARIREKI